VRPGWEVVAIDKEKLAPIMEKVSKALKKESGKAAESTLAIVKRLRGKEGSKLSIVFRDGKDKEIPLEIPLVHPPGLPTTIGHLPTLYVDFEAKQLLKDIGYFRLTTFADPPRVMPAFQKVIQESLNDKGFILDLRGNPGGLGIMAVGLGNWFFNKEDLKLGTMILRQGKISFVLNRRAQTFDGPLAILVDELSGSTSEILAGGLQDLGRARVFGTRSMGAALPSTFERLPNGDGFQYAVANYISTGGKPLEGRGVHPDVVVPLTRAALLSGHDPVLEAAIGWIQNQAKGTGKSGNP
jgi:carboxyl-terminal processing protease